jgi:hypothetical protein
MWQNEKPGFLRVCSNWEKLIYLGWDSSVWTPCQSALLYGQKPTNIINSVVHII